MSIINTAPKPEQNEVQLSVPQPNATSKASVAAVLIAAGIVAAMLMTFANGLDETAVVTVDSAGGTVRSVKSAVVSQSDVVLLDRYRLPSHGQFAGLNAREFSNSLFDTFSYPATGNGDGVSSSNGRYTGHGSLPDLDAREYPNAVINTVRPTSSDTVSDLDVGQGVRAAPGSNSYTHFGQFAGLNVREYSHAAVGDHLTTLGPLIELDAGDVDGVLLGNGANTNLGTFPELDASEYPNTLPGSDDDIGSRSSPDADAGEGANDRRTSFAAHRARDAIANRPALLLSEIAISVWPGPELHGEDDHRTNFEADHARDVIASQPVLLLNDIAFRIWPGPELHGEEVESDSQTHIGPSIEPSE